MLEFQITKPNLSLHKLGLYPIHRISQTPFILKLPWPTIKPKRYKKNQYKYNLASSFRIQKSALFQVTCTLITALARNFLLTWAPRHIFIYLSNHMNLTWHNFTYLIDYKNLTWHIVLCLNDCRNFICCSYHINYLHYIIHP